MELDLIQTLRIVDACAVSEWQKILAWICLAALAAIVFGVAICYAVRKLDRLRRRDKGLALVAVVGIAVSVLYGGIGSGWGFTFIPETGIYDAGSFVDTETGTIYAIWNYEPYVASYKFKWFFTFKYGGEKSDPIQLPDANVSDGYAVCPIPVPEGMEFDAFTVTCYTEYVKPTHVVTNGSYHLDGVMRSIDSTNSPMPKYVTPGISIYANREDGRNERLAPPANDLPGVIYISKDMLYQGEEQ